MRPRTRARARAGDARAGRPRAAWRDVSARALRRPAAARRAGARARAAPELLLLDEPFSNLDVDLRERLALEVREILKASGTTAMLVTHDQHEAFAIADEIGVMHDGASSSGTGLQPLSPPGDPLRRRLRRPGRVPAGQGAVATQCRIELGVLEGEFRCTCRAGCAALRQGLPRRRAAAARRRGARRRQPAAGRSGAQGVPRRRVLYTLRLASGREVLALVPSHHNHAIGERIGIRLDVDHVVAFPARSPQDQCKVG